MVIAETDICLLTNISGLGQVDDFKRGTSMPRGISNSVLKREECLISL